MRACLILLSGLAFGAFSLHAACGGAERTVRDWGLHRAWVVVEDCVHPARPAQLREIPWRAAAIDARPIAGEGTQQGEPGAAAALPAVRAGMRVEVWSQGARAEVHVMGTTLRTARMGERVRVRISMDGAVRMGVVRGPAMVELISGRTER